MTSKSALKEWANERGSGSVFSVDLLDALDEIKATFYKDAANKFFDLLVEGKVSGYLMLYVFMQFLSLHLMYGT